MIKYLGSKRKLLEQIEKAVRGEENFEHILDLFSGTARVGHHLKKSGFRVTSNDHNAYATCLARCYVEADKEKYEDDAKRLIEEFSSLAPAPGYFTESFCEGAMFFHPKNGARVDAIRDAIEAKDLEPILKSILLTSLMEAADRVDSTCGVQMAYLKEWAPRAHNDLVLRLPDMTPASSFGPSRAICGDALETAAATPVDVAYLDPPYNQHSYLGNYHIWETLVRWDKPELYGRAQKRIDVRERKSAFNSKPAAVDAMQAVVDAVRCKRMVVSFSNEGFISRERMEEMLSARGAVDVIVCDYKRYVGAQIGIYNPSGDRVGEVSHLENKEYIYIVDCR